MEIEAIFKLVSVVLLFATLIASAVTDILHRKVYNWITFPAMALGLALGYGMGGVGSFGLQPAGVGFLHHLAGMLLGFGVFYGFYLSTGGKAVGLGDVKLMAAIGALTGFQFTVGAMFWGSLVGAVIAVWVLLWRGSLLTGLKSTARYAVSLRREADSADPAHELAKIRIPYGTAIALGSMLAWFLMELPQA